MLMSLLRCPPQWLYAYFYQPEGRYPAEPVQRVPAESRVLHSSCELCFLFLFVLLIVLLLLEVQIKVS